MNLKTLYSNGLSGLPFNGLLCQNIDFIRLVSSFLEIQINFLNEISFSKFDIQLAKYMCQNCSKGDVEEQMRRFLSHFLFNAAIG